DPDAVSGAVAGRVWPARHRLGVPIPVPEPVTSAVRLRGDRWGRTVLRPAGGDHSDWAPRVQDTGTTGRTARCRPRTGRSACRYRFRNEDRAAHTPRPGRGGPARPLSRRSGRASELRRRTHRPGVAGPPGRAVPA